MIISAKEAQDLAINNPQTAAAFFMEHFLDKEIREVAASNNNIVWPLCQSEDGHNLLLVIPKFKELSQEDKKKLAPVQDIKNTSAVSSEVTSIVRHTLSMLGYKDHIQHINGQPHLKIVW